MVGLVACESEKKPDTNAILDSLSQAQAQAGPSLSEDEINGILQQIPSPLEISFLLKAVGSEYDGDLLNDPDNHREYNTAFKQAMNLGLYGTDLGYINIFEQNQEAIYYLQAIKNLADDLSIGKFFDFSTIRRLATSSSNLDSLLLVTTRNFNDINSYLQNQKRSKLSILFLSAGWLEALHITSAVLDKNPENQELKEKIGEQQIVLDLIIVVLEKYKNDPDPSYGKLYSQMSQLKAAFDKIEIERIDREPTMIEIDGIPVLQDNSETIIKISDQNIAEINGITNTIRNNIIN